MTHPIFHAQTSAKIWGGKPEDYLALHEFLDEPKKYFCDFRHRALRHHSLGIFQAQEVFGQTITNSKGQIVPIRYVLEQHCKEDCGGRIPSVQDWLSQIRPAAWMSKGYKIEVEE